MYSGRSSWISLAKDSGSIWNLCRRDTISLSLCMHISERLDRSFCSLAPSGVYLHQIVKFSGSTVASCPSLFRSQQQPGIKNISVPCHFPSQERQIPASWEALQVARISDTYSTLVPLIWMRNLKSYIFWWHWLMPATSCPLDLLCSQHLLGIQMLILPVLRVCNMYTNLPVRKIIQQFLSFCKKDGKSCRQVLSVVNKSHWVKRLYAWYSNPKSL